MQEINDSEALMLIAEAYEFGRMIACPLTVCDANVDVDSKGFCDAFLIASHSTKSKIHNLWVDSEVLNVKLVVHLPFRQWHSNELNIILCIISHIAYLIGI